MNHCYRLIWSGHRAAWVVAPETAGKRKGAGSTSFSRACGRALALTMLSAAFSPVWALDPGALPTGGTVVAGQAQILHPGQQLQVLQSSTRAVMDWQSFNIGREAQVQITQPDTHSVSLHRVLGNQGSELFGQLSSNGQVFLSNPNGVLFGSSAQVNVGGLVATTLNLDTQEFMNGRIHLRNGGNAGAVVNQGQLTAADHGYVALLAPTVVNQGAIRTHLGTALLGAADQVSLTLDNGSLLSYQIDQGAAQALVDNQQLVQADVARCG